MNAETAQKLQVLKPLQVLPAQGAKEIETHEPNGSSEAFFNIQVSSQTRIIFLKNFIAVKSHHHHNCSGNKGCRNVLSQSKK